MEAWALMGARERAVETEQGRDGKWDWKSVESLRMLCRGGRTYQVSSRKQMENIQMA